MQIMSKMLIDVIMKKLAQIEMHIQMHTEMQMQTQMQMQINTWMQMYSYIHIYIYIYIFNMKMLKFILCLIVFAQWTTNNYIHCVESFSPRYSGCCSAVKMSQ